VKILAPALSALLLLGCTLGPDYERPGFDLPEAHRDAPPAGLAADAGAFGELGWWQVYRDPALQLLVRDALLRHPDVNIAAARVQFAQAQIGSTRLQALPQLEAGGGYQRLRSSEFNRSPSQDSIRSSWNLQLAVSYELDLWGRLARLNEAARAELLAAQHQRAAVVAGLLASTASSYFTLVALDEQLATLRANLGHRRKFIELTKERYEAGAANALELLSAEAQFAAGESSIADSERQIALNENLLSNLTARKPGPVRRSPSAEAAFVAASLPPVDLPAQLLERRPDLRAAEAQLIAANANVGAVKASLLPSLSLTGAFGVVSNSLSRLLSGDAVAWSAGAGLLQPLLDPQRNRYQLDAADARRIEATELYRRSVLNALREVADALVERQKQAEALDAQRRQTEAATQARDIALTRYRAGYSAYFEVISAERDLSAAQLQQIATRRDLQLAVLRLYLALGGGWTPEAPTG